MNSDGILDGIIDEPAIDADQVGHMVRRDPSLLRDIYVNYQRRDSAVRFTNAAITAWKSAHALDDREAIASHMPGLAAYSARHRGLVTGLLVNVELSFGADVSRSRAFLSEMTGLSRAVLRSTMAERKR